MPGANARGGLEMNEFLNLASNAEDYLGRFTVEMYAFDGASPPRKPRKRTCDTVARLPPLVKVFND